MKCQKCGVNEATTHIKTVVNGEYAEYVLCSECAKEMGYSNVFSDFATDFGSLLGSFFGNALPARTGAARCPVCGSTYTEIRKCGQVGCAACYETFADELMPSIKRIHGNTTHCGKHSSVALARKENPNTQKTKSRLESLKEKMAEAVKNQDFENAAKLRDEIKGLEAQDNEK